MGRGRAPGGFPAFGLAVTGAGAYHVYRGEMADLVNSNSDGLPDYGYGACVSHSDPDPTDTVFIDAVTPDPGDGLFYLVCEARAAEELDLGTTSGGQPRSVMVACP